MMNHLTDQRKRVWWLTVLLLAGIAPGTLGQAPAPAEPAAPGAAISTPPPVTPAPPATPDAARPARPAAAPKPPRTSTGGGFGVGGMSGSGGVEVAPRALPSPNAGRFGGYGGVAAGVMPGPAPAPPFVQMGRYGGASGRGPNTPVLVEFTNADPRKLQELEVDLAIMSRIVEQAVQRSVGEEAPASKMGVPLIYTSPGRTFRALHLEGFGALFTLSVNFPLVAPPEGETRSLDKEASSDWEAARRELLGQESAEEGLAMDGGGSALPFSADRVQALQQALSKALTNASHIRGLGPDDSVGIAVFGSPGSGIGGFFEAGAGYARAFQGYGSSYGSGYGSGGGSANTTGEVLGAPLMAKTSVLVLRASKASIDACAAGKTSFEDFMKRLSVNTYASAAPSDLGITTRTRRATQNLYK